MAEWTGLEPATLGVTGRYSNQLNYHSMNPNNRSCQTSTVCRDAVPVGNAPANPGGC